MQTYNPGPACRLAKLLYAKDICGEKRGRIQNGVAVVGLCRKVDDHVYRMGLKQGLYACQITNVTLFEDTAFSDYTGQILLATRVSKRIKREQVVFRMNLLPVPDKVRADETGCASDEESHDYLSNN